MPNLPKIDHATTVMTVRHLCFLVLVSRLEWSSWLSYLKEKKQHLKVNTSTFLHIWSMFWSCQAL